MSDLNEMTDAVATDLNPTGPEPDYGLQAELIPDRPADGASADKWVDYLVALGGDRTYLTQMTAHQDGPDQVEMIPPLKRADLIELADRLGG